jgi:hypothetical protein
MSEDPSIPVFVTLSIDSEEHRSAFERVVERVNRKKSSSLLYQLRTMYLELDRSSTRTQASLENSARDLAARCELFVGVLWAPRREAASPWRPGADTELRAASQQLLSRGPARAFIYFENARVPFGAGLRDMGPYVAFASLREELQRFASLTMFTSQADMEERLEEDLQKILSRGEEFLKHRDPAQPGRNWRSAAAENEPAVGLPSPDAKPEQLEPPSHHLSPTGQERRVWKECDGRVTIEDIARLTEMETNVVQKIVAKLHQDKLVRLPPPPGKARRNWRNI